MTEDLTAADYRAMSLEMTNLAAEHRDCARRTSLGFDRALLLEQARDYERASRLLGAAASADDPTRLLVALGAMQPRIAERAAELITVAEVQRTLGGV